MVALVAVEELLHVDAFNDDSLYSKPELALCKSGKYREEILSATQ